jgi:hypothetical protein
VDAIAVADGEFTARAAPAAGSSTRSPDNAQQVQCRRDGRSQQAVDRDHWIQPMGAGDPFGRGCTIDRHARSTGFFLKQSFVGPVPPALIDYAYATAHQPGAHYAPLRFVSGLLFTRSARQELYARLALPVQVVYDRDAFVRFDALRVSTAPAAWRACRHSKPAATCWFEALPQLAAVLEAF